MERWSPAAQLADVQGDDLDCRDLIPPEYTLPGLSFSPPFTDGVQGVAQPASEGLPCIPMARRTVVHQAPPSTPAVCTDSSASSAQNPALELEENAGLRFDQRSLTNQPAHDLQEETLFFPTADEVRDYFQSLSELEPSLLYRNETQDTAESAFMIPCTSMAGRPDKGQDILDTPDVCLNLPAQNPPRSVAGYGINMGVQEEPGHDLLPEKQRRNSEQSCICTLCGETCAGKKHLKSHMATHSHNKAYSCEQCGKRYKNRDHFKRHIRLHTESPYLRCTLCDYIVETSEELEEHYADHNRYKALPYSCKHCFFAFKYPCHLKRHMRHHSEDRPHACLHCAKKYKALTSLKRHEGRCHNMIKARPNPVPRSVGLVATWVSRTISETTGFRDPASSQGKAPESPPDPKDLNHPPSE